MNNIIKRRKTSNYLQLHNFPVQEDLDDLAAIGLLTYIMSLPEDWVLYKTQLQSKFTRRKVDSAWKILVQKKYIVGFICYIDGKKSYFYNVSDIAFTEEDYLDFVEENLKYYVSQGKSVSSLKEIPDNAYPIPDLTTAQNVQQKNLLYKNYSTIVEIQNVQIQKKYIQKKLEQININNNIVNSQETINNPDPNNFKELLINSSNEFYNEFAPGRWTKKQWNILMEKFANETIESGRYINVPQEKIKGYAYKAIEKMAYHYDLKNGKLDFSERNENIPSLFYDWLEDLDDENL